MWVVALVAEFAFLVGALFFSARWTIRPRGSANGIVWGALVFYGLSIGGAFLFSVVIPTLLISLGVDRFVVYASFPEVICVTRVVLFGWFFALVFAITVRVLYDAIRIFRGGRWTLWDDGK